MSTTGTLQGHERATNAQMLLTRSHMHRPTRLAPSALAFLRFVAGVRALLAVLSCIVLLINPETSWGLDLAILLPYLIWTGVLLWKTLDGWPRAASKAWLWVDAGVLLVTSQLVAGTLPLFGIATVLPVVAVAVLAGAFPATILAITCAAVMLALTESLRSLGSLPALPVSVPVILLALGPAAALLARPSRELRQRLKLVETVNGLADPRQGLRHHVDALLQQLASHFGLSAATVSLHGPEPRVFHWKQGAPTVVLSDEDAVLWRKRLSALPRDAGCIGTAGGTIASTTAINVTTGARSNVLDEDAKRAIAGIGAQALALPLMSYGQPLGMLCLSRRAPEFSSADLRWLNDVMRETIPLLERSDLLEQLQRETASRERERIGRDLHDSAVQPYLGLKYGLEALARQAGPDNPVSHHIHQLVAMATEELRTLRDVVSGLRRGDDPSQEDCVPLAALQREALRFESLYGLKVNVFAPHAPRLRGAAAKAVLHMVNEALTNARRHTSARAVTVLLDVNQTDVLLRLRNDHGPEETLPADFLPRSLTERATELGGGVEVNHQPDFTEIVITLPLLGIVG